MTNKNKTKRIFLIILGFFTFNNYIWAARQNGGGDGQVAYPEETNEVISDLISYKIGDLSNNISKAHEEASNAKDRIVVLSDFFKKHFPEMKKGFATGFAVLLIILYFTLKYINKIDKRTKKEGGAYEYLKLRIQKEYNSPLNKTKRYFRRIKMGFKRNYWRWFWVLLLLIAIFFRLLRRKKKKR